MHITAQRSAQSPGTLAEDNASTADLSRCAFLRGAAAAAIAASGISGAGRAFANPDIAPGV